MTEQHDPQIDAERAYLATAKAALHAMHHDVLNTATPLQRIDTDLLPVSVFLLVQRCPIRQHVARTRVPARKVRQAG